VIAPCEQDLDLAAVSVVRDASAKAAKGDSSRQAPRARKAIAEGNALG
jgi:hypothetical protein